MFAKWCQQTSRFAWYVSHWHGERFRVVDRFLSKRMGLRLQSFQINRTGKDSTVPVATNLADAAGAVRKHTGWFWLEVAAIFCVLFAFAGQATPDVNETHYLTKAKSFWSPEWCAKDLFLQSSDAHLVFFLSFGWLTKFLSLTTFAWVGRCISWGIFSFAWVRLNRTLDIRPGLAILSAVFFLLLMDRFHMAGEWAVGGFEGKSIAFGFVILAIDAYLKPNFPRLFLLLGIASAFHVVVGAWTILAFCIAAAILRVANRQQLLLSQATGSPKFVIYAVVGIVLFIAGAVPPLLNDAGATLTEKSQAAEILVHHRLSHHLFFGDFATMMVARFAMLVVLWFIFARVVRFDKRLARINLFCLGSLVIAFGGLVLSGVSEESLRTSLVCVRVVSSWLFKSALRSQQILTVASIGMVIAAAVLLVSDKWRDGRPRADRAALPSYSAVDRTMDTFKNWKKVCFWIRENTPDDAVFITPDAQQTFKWYAQRAEVVCWKDVPQDAANVVRWNERVQALSLPQRASLAGLLSYTDQQLIELADKYNANFLVVMQMQVDLANEESKFPDDGRILQVYPVDSNEKSTYAVFKIESD